MNRILTQTNQTNGLAMGKLTNTNHPNQTNQKGGGLAIN